MKKKKLINREFGYFLSTLYHILAMVVPSSKMKAHFYRIRGSKIGEGIDFGNFVFLEDYRPDLITIGNSTDIGPRVIIVTHDSSVKCVKEDGLLHEGEVVIENHVYIGAGTIILPGVHIGHHTIIGAGSIVHGTIPDNVVAVGNPAKIVCSVTDYFEKKIMPGNEESL